MEDELNWLGARKGKSKGKGDRRKGKGKGKDFGKCGGGGQWYGKGNGGCTWCGDENHWHADCEKLKKHKKHKADMETDRKKKGLPAFVPRPRTVYSLEPEERNRGRKIADDDNDDSEVTGLVCDSDDGVGDCDMLEVES